jgi:hypothetical protein
MQCPGRLRIRSLCRRPTAQRIASIMNDWFESLPSTNFALASATPFSPTDRETVAFPPLADIAAVSPETCGHKV